MTEKSEFREMRSFDLAIRRAYFKAQIRRNYAKNVVINRSAFVSAHVFNQKSQTSEISAKCILDIKAWVKVFRIMPEFRIFDLHKGHFCDSCKSEEIFGGWGGGGVGSNNIFPSIR